MGGVLGVVVGCIRDAQMEGKGENETRTKGV